MSRWTWDHQWQYGTWRRSTDPSISGRFATGGAHRHGRYRVRLPNLASPHGTTHAQQGVAAADYTATSCQLTDAYIVGPDQIAEIGCFDAAGVPRNLPFVLAYLGASDGSRPMVSARYDRASGTAKGAQVSRTGIGTYLVRGFGSFNGRGAATLTVINDTAAHCQNNGILAGDGVQISVFCHAPGGAPIDTGWMLSYVEQTGSHHDPAAPAAYVTTGGDPANPMVPTDRSWASNRETPKVVRTQTGRYEINYTEIGNPSKYPGDVTLVTAIAPATRYCLVRAWNTYSNGQPLKVQIDCYDGAGRFADAHFNVACLRSY